VTVGWLLDQLDDILLHPGSVEFGLSVLRWQRRLRGMAKVDPASKGSPIRCPRCNEPQVRRRDDDYYECGTCGRLLTQKEHDREFSKQAEQHDHERQEAHA
jgi:DNA-directed RNA polymerase subunit RPC12/RpoP